MTSMRSRSISLTAYAKDIASVFVLNPMVVVAFGLAIAVLIVLTIIMMPFAFVGAAIHDALGAIDDRSSLDWKRRRIRSLIEVPHIAGAPGWRLYRTASWLYSRRTFQEVFVPVLSDMQVEYFDALATRQPWKARWIRVKGLVMFLSHMAAQLPVSLGRILGITGWRSPL